VIWGRAGCLVAAVSIAACAPEPAPDFDSPAAAVYDAAADRYLVSNVGGGAVAKDGDGSILAVSPIDGARTVLARGGRDGARLDAPRGMALDGEALWVADVDVVRRFERASGAPAGEFVIPGASMLWGVTVAPDGVVYVSDVGLDADMAPTGTDAIWKITPSGEVSLLVQGPELGQPSAISAQRAGIYAAGWRDGAFFQVDYRGVKTDLSRAPKAQLSGLARIEVEGYIRGQRAMVPTWFAASWGGSAIYRFAMTGGVSAIDAVVDAPGGLAFDLRRRRLLVPLSKTNRLHVEQL